MNNMDLLKEWAREQKAKQGVPLCRVASQGTVEFCGRLMKAEVVADVVMIPGKYVYAQMSGNIVVVVGE